MDFPGQFVNPQGARPCVFGCVFGPAPGEAGRRGDVLACAFGIDPGARRSGRAWAPGWGSAMHLCDWRGGRLDADPLENFVVFGEGAGRWLQKSGARGMRHPLPRALAMAEAGMDYLALRYGAPRGGWAALAWIAKRPPGSGREGAMLAAGLAHGQSLLAKRLLMSGCEAAELGREAADGSGEAGRPRL